MEGLICKLRKIEEKDLEQLREWRNSDFVRNRMISRNLISKDQQISWFEKNKSNETRIDFMIEKNDGTPIGSANIFDINHEHKRAEWGFYLGKEEFTMGGYGLEAMILVYRYGFEILGLEKVYCQTLASNSKVVQMHKTFGLEEEGVLKQHYLFNGEWDDVHYMSLFKENYDQKAKKIIEMIKRFYV
jgi:UDP-4-amino-4,6-dideoxy-N-acetyl-beta-L-altrosamine N-acetyltransferase